MDAGWTQALERVKRGEAGAQEALYALVYEHLYRLARRAAPGATLTPTALVHEAFLKLAGHEAGVVDQQHFLALAARAMRHIVVDHARRKAALRRQAPEAPAGDVAASTHDEVLAVHDALARLEAVDARLAKVVELRFFAGFSEEEIAEATGVTVRTVRRDWRKARAFLYEAIHGKPLT